MFQSFKGQKTELLLKAKQISSKLRSQNLFFKCPSKRNATMDLKNSIESYKDAWLKVVLSKQESP